MSANQAEIDETISSDQNLSLSSSDPISSTSSPTTASHPCIVCGKQDGKLCSGCKSIAYCCIEHQKSDWKNHRKSCIVYAIESDEKYGRFIVASRDIEPGTIIMNEKVLIYGPKQDTLPICLGCHKLLLQVKSPPPSKNHYYCSKCTFPLCGPSCENAPIHANNECKLFSQNHVSFPKIINYLQQAPIYECILTLRCLLLKKSDPKKWKQLIAMTHQNENRKKVLPGLWYRNQMNTVRTLSEDCKLKNEFTELEIHSVIGYIDINAFEVKINGGYDVSGLFNNTYIMSHDCHSNTHHTFTPDFRMIVRASVPIKKGEQITTVYASILDGTAQRSIELYESKFFTCTCRRCLDPTELSTYFSGLVCTSCTAAVPPSPGKSGEGIAVPINPLDQTTNWRCETCSNIIPNETVAQLTEKIFTEIQKVEEELQTNPGINISKFEGIIKSYSKIILHENHYLMIQVLHSLVSLYGRVNGWLVHQLSLERLRRMEEICHHLLRVLDVIEAGMSRLRGFTLYQLHAAIFHITKLECKSQKLNKTELHSSLTQVLQLLKESYAILSFDDVNTPEGVIAKSIPSSIQDVEKMLNEISESENNNSI